VVRLQLDARTTPSAKWPARTNGHSHCHQTQPLEAYSQL
jgi:hypothetical protein